MPFEPACGPRSGPRRPGACVIEARTRTPTPPSRPGSPGATATPASGCTPAGRATTRWRCDLRLYLKDALLGLHAGALELAERAPRPSPRGTAPPSGRGTPTSGGPCRRRRRLWAAGVCGGAARRPPSRCRRSGTRWTARRWGVPRATACRCRSGARSAMRSLGFAGLDHAVTSVQLGRGKLEAAVLAWCAELGHDLVAAGGGRDPALEPRSSACWCCRPT